MHDHTFSADRRRFLGLTATAAAIAGLGQATRAARGADDPASPPAAPASAKPAATRGADHRPKIGLAAYSFRDQLTGKAGPAMTLESFIDYCAEQGLEGTELTGYYVPEPVRADYLRRLRRRAFRAGVTVTGTAIRNDFGLADPAAVKKEIAHVKAWSDHAAAMGAPVIRIFAGQVPEGADHAATIKQIAASIEECCEYAGERGVHLALEDHGGPTATADGLFEICDLVKSDWFGVNLDTGNFRSPDPYADIERAVPRAINCQVKLAVTPIGADGKQGREPADIPRVAKLLRAGGYNGFVVLEYEEPGDPLRHIPPALAQLREALASA